VKRYRPHILVVAALAIVLSTGWHGALRSALTDLRFAGQSREASGDIAVVAIDAPSIDQIGVWPWPRGLHAELLRKLESAGVQDVAFDVDFSTPSDAASDQAFVAALKDVGGATILPSFKQPAQNGGGVHINRPLKPFGEQSWPAVVNVAVEADGLVRRYPFGEKLGDAFVPSMAAVLAGQYASRSTPFLIDFSIRAASIPRVSFADVLRGDGATLAKLKDKKVIVGATALELGDRFSVPNGNIASGPVLQALAAESIVQHRTLRWTSDIGMILGLIALALLMMFAWHRFGPGMRVVILVATAAAVELVAALVQLKWPLVIDTSLFHIATIAYLTAIALDEIDFRSLLGRIAESRFHRIAMSLGDGLVCTDENHMITVWNPGASAIFGYMPAEMIGRPFEALCAVPDKDAGKRFAMRDAARQALLVPGGAVVVEFEGRRKNGEMFPVEASFSGWQGTDGFQYGAILRDISVRKREAERVKYLAEYDSLTGLANRNTLHTGLIGLVAAAERHSHEVALLVLGLDGFQQINDMLGHAVGDVVLRAVAERLRAEAGNKAIVARLSGDEFAIAIDCAEAAEPIAEFADRIARAFELPLAAGTRQHRVRISVGIAVYPDGGRNVDDLLSNAHLALCRAKMTRRGSHVIFESTIRQELENRLTLESELAQAADHNEFELFYQPQVRLIDGALLGAEALIRWRHPVCGYVSAEFMPVVNTSALSERIAGWVMETACKQARAWELLGNCVRVAINLSPSQLHSGDLAQSVSELLASTGLTPSLLELEVTEDILLLDEARVLDMFKRIQELGVRILFDDFGTGYASLSYLKKFPLDGLKIDRSFVLDLLADSDDAAIVSSTVGLSKQLGLSVIAEGIENRATADFLVGMGCEEGQGYFFGRPMPAAAFERQFLTVQQVRVAVGAA
jgi:diguanylate cyclase (GGDEF)-like protein/PAS domain S-box-containing protein